MKRYCRLTFRLPEDRERTVWCYKLSQVSYQVYQVVKKDGDRVSEIVVIDPSDIISLHPAEMNLKYMELEILPANT